MLLDGTYVSRGKKTRRYIFRHCSNEKEISATLIERQNLAFRQDKNRVSRKIIISKKVIEFKK